jgi:thymidylate synthase
MDKKYLNKNGEPLSRKDFIEKIKTDDDFAEEWGDMGPIYGAQWRDWNGIDQIANLIKDLKNNPNSRRLMVSAWHVDEIDDMKLPPCHYGFQIYTRELSEKERVSILDKIPADEKRTINIGSADVLEINRIPKREISLMWQQRSVDTPLGSPFNIASYGLLLEILAKEVNMIPGELIGNFGDTHIYRNQLDGVKEQLKRDIHDLPTLTISEDFYKTKLEDLTYDMFKLNDYTSGDKIFFPLSN